MPALPPTFPAHPRGGHAVPSTLSAALPSSSSPDAYARGVDAAPCCQGVRVRRIALLRMLVAGLFRSLARSHTELHRLLVGPPWRLLASQYRGMTSRPHRSSL